MVTQETLSGNWHNVVGAVKQKFGQITGDDLTRVQGNVDQLVGMIQKKTGETRENIEKFLSNCCSGTESTYQKVAAQGAALANQAGQAIDDGFKQISHQAEQGYEYAKGTVSQRPIESLAVVAGVGLIAGLALGLSMASRR